MRGLSRLNLVYMRTFAAGFPDGIAQHPIAQLPWGHVTVLVDKLDERAARDWYAAAAVEHGWSRDVLAHQITNRLHARAGAAPSNFPAQLSVADSELAQQLVRDPGGPARRGCWRPRRAGTHRPPHPCRAVARARCRVLG